MIRSNRSFKNMLYENISNEPVNVHCYCNKCGKKIILPEKVWLKRGSVCNRCYHQIHYWED